MTGERSADDYLLPEEVNRRIFNQEIVPDKMWGIQPQDDPVVVFLVGQHGAGKSRVAAMIAPVLNARGGFVDIDNDLYKPYHPAYDALMAGDGKLMWPSPRPTVGPGQCEPTNTSATPDTGSTPSSRPPPRTPRRRRPG